MKQTPEALRSRIYKLAESRIEAARAKMPCSAALFEALAAQRPDSVDYTLLKDLDNRDFIEAVFSLLLGRPLDDATRAAWQDRTDSMPQEQFRTAVLRSVLRSAEYQRRMTPLCRCPLPVAEESGQINVQVAPQQMPDRLMRVYRKLPAPMKKLAKKLAGKEEA